MHRKQHGYFDPIAVSILALLITQGASAAFLGSGVYDENVVQSNTVDVSATTDSSQTVSFATFSNEMTIAYLADAGGVIDFDSGSLTDPNTIDSNYGNNVDKKIRITNSTTRGMEIVSPVFSPTPVSGNQALRKISGSTSFGANSYRFDFDPDDEVISVGATILWQAGFPTGVGAVTGFVRYSDNTTSPFVTRNIPGLHSENDTFWGFRAPVGESIKELQLSISSGAFANLDDLGFILRHDTADFNSDGDIDGDDFLTWQRGYPKGSSRIEGDATGDGEVTEKDLFIWNSQYELASSPSLEVLAVPEPSGLILVGVTLIQVAWLRRFSLNSHRERPT